MVYVVVYVVCIDCDVYIDVNSYFYNWICILLINYKKCIYLCMYIYVKWFMVYDIICLYLINICESVIYKVVIYINI